MALIEGIRPLYFTATSATDVFGRRLSGQTFHPFSGYIRHVPLAALLWELATAFGSARLTREDECVFQVSALGEDLPWAPYHAEQDLLWCTQRAPASSRESHGRDEALRETQPERSPSKSRKRASTTTPSARRSIAFLTFSVQRMFQLVCALDDHQEMLDTQVEGVIRARGDEYRRFLRSGELVDFADGVWKAGEQVRRLSAALRNERIEEVRQVLLKVPSFAVFARRLENLPPGSVLDTTGLERGLRTYRILGEVTLLCAAVPGSGIYATPKVPDAAEFSRIALRRFTSLDREGHGLVATGEWLECLIRDEGIHPEVARRLLDEVSETGRLRRSTEGSTTQLRFDDHIVHVLRTDAGLPVVEAIHLYRGDYLIPGKASVSLRVEDPAA